MINSLLCFNSPQPWILILLKPSLWLKYTFKKKTTSRSSTQWLDGWSDLKLSYFLTCIGSYRLATLVTHVFNILNNRCAFGAIKHRVFCFSRVFYESGIIWNMWKHYILLLLCTYTYSLKDAENSYSIVVRCEVLHRGTRTSMGQSRVP